jgi:hypothetical protein
MVLERTNGATPEIVSVLSQLPSKEVRSKYRVLLRVMWGYAALPNGLPTEEELIRAPEHYAALDRIIGVGGVHAMTRSGDGGRTHYYYIKDPSAHAKALREYFDSLPPISVKIVARDEPDWDSVREVLEGVR